MPERIVEIQALAPLLFRDGRPFAMSEGSETSAQSLPLPLPSTVAGLVRTQVAKATGLSFNDYQALQNLHGLQICSPLLVRGPDFMLPAPRDAVVYRDDSAQLRVMRLEPKKLEQGGCDLPDGLWPLEVSQDVKPADGYLFWTHEEVTRWLLGEVFVPEKEGGLVKEQRVHVGIDPASGRAREGMLYSVAYRSLESKNQEWRIRARVRLDAVPEPLGFLGGERRPVRLRVHDDLGRYWFGCSPQIKEVFTNFNCEKQLVRMVLATPALFEHGWKPGWVDRSGSGAQHLPRGLSKVKLRLVAAAVGRREPVSGWNLRENRPKRVRWMVPAGSVYFFEVESGNPADLLESWLRPVSDYEQDRKDGFGLAMWGVGNYAD